MFGFGKNKKQKSKKQGKAGSAAVKKAGGGKPSREEIIAQAMSNARKATNEIGEENLQRIAAAMMKKENSATERARQKIKTMDKDKVVDHLRIMLDED